MAIKSTQLLLELAPSILAIAGIFVTMLGGYGLAEIINLQDYETGTLFWVSAASYLAVAPISQMIVPVPKMSRFWQSLCLLLSVTIIALPFLRDLIGISLPFMWSFYTTETLLLAVAYGGACGLTWEVVINRLLVKRLGLLEA